VTLREARCKFTMLQALLVLRALDMGFEVAGGELVRDARVAALNAKSGSGISNSLHVQGLAIDLHLYKDGKYLSETESHRPLGEWWKQQDEHCRWGGDIAHRPDGNHYSFNPFEDGRI